MDPERKLIASDAETGEYREGTVYCTCLPAGYRASFISAVEVLHCVIGEVTLGKGLSVNTSPRETYTKERESVFGGMERWNGMVEWTTGMPHPLPRLSVVP